MNAAMLLSEDMDLELHVSFRNHEAPRRQRDLTSSSKWTTQARYRRRAAKGSNSFTGSHRRRQKRNYL